MKEVSNETYLLVGVDIGGSHITAALVDLDKRCKVPGTEIRKEVNSDGSAEEILMVWQEAIKEVINNSNLPIKRLGIAMPGPFDYEKGISLIKNMNKYEALYGLNIREILAAGLKLEPSDILFRNDAEAFLDGEVYCGAAKDFSNIIGITLGTGLGSATSINGFTKDANLGVSLFMDGIAEDYLSIRWFLKRHFELKLERVQDIKTLAIAAENGDGIAIKIFEEFRTNLSDFLIRFIKANNPEMVVVGGNIARAENLYLQFIRATVSKQFPDVSIVTSMLWEEAALVGAAHCWLREKAVN